MEVAAVHKKWRSPLRISSGNMIKPAVLLFKARAIWQSQVIFHFLSEKRFTRCHVIFISSFLFHLTCFRWSWLRNRTVSLTLSWQRSLSYRNQSIDLHCKSMDWFLYDRDLRHERILNVYQKFRWNIRLGTLLNSCYGICLFLYPRKTSENHWSSAVFQKQ